MGAHNFPHGEPNQMERLMAPDTDIVEDVAQTLGVDKETLIALVAEHQILAAVETDNADRVRLRKAAEDYVAALKSPVKDGTDSGFGKIDRRLMAAGLALCSPSIVERNELLKKLELMTEERDIALREIERLQAGKS